LIGFRLNWDLASDVAFHNIGAMQFATITSPLIYDYLEHQQHTNHNLESAQITDVVSYFPKTCFICHMVFYTKHECIGVEEWSHVNAERKDEVIALMSMGTEN